MVHLNGQQALWYARDRGLTKGEDNNEIGLNANFNMKREYQSEEELQANTDVLLPLVDNMLACRKEAVEFINKTYGTSISVEKNSSWENKQFERETEKEMKKNEAEAAKEEGNA